MHPINAPAPVRKIRSFIRRYRGFTPAQAEEYAALWEQYGLHSTSPFTFNPPCILDIGFGQGESLLYLAKQQPNAFYLGIEVHKPGIFHLMRALKKAQLHNVQLMEGDALEILTSHIPNHCFSKIQLFFPDPWPKKRHHKRRLLRDETLQLFQTKLISGGELHIATDWQNYAERIQQLIAQYPSFQAIIDDEPIDIYHLRPLTRFEQKGKKAGRKIFDLRFKWIG